MSAGLVLDEFNLDLAPAGLLVALGLLVILVVVSARLSRVVVGDERVFGRRVVGAVGVVEAAFVAGEALWGRVWHGGEREEGRGGRAEDGGRTRLVRGEGARKGLPGNGRSRGGKSLPFSVTALYIRVPQTGLPPPSHATAQTPLSILSPSRTPPATAGLAHQLFPALPSAQCIVPRHCLFLPPAVQGEAVPAVLHCSGHHEHMSVLRAVCASAGTTRDLLDPAARHSARIWQVGCYIGALSHPHSEHPGSTGQPNREIALHASQIRSPASRCDLMRLSRLGGASLPISRILARLLALRSIVVRRELFHASPTSRLASSARRVRQLRECLLHHASARCATRQRRAGYRLCKFATQSCIAFPPTPNQRALKVLATRRAHVHVLGVPHHPRYLDMLPLDPEIMIYLCTQISARPRTADRSDRHRGIPP